MDVRNLFVKHLKYILPLVCLWGAYIASGITCPIRMVFSVPCPTCGTTRALLSLAHGDLPGYLHYQPMAVFLVTAVVLVFHLRITRHKKIVLGYVITVLVLNLILFFTRL